MTEPASQPIFFVVDEDQTVMETLVGDLERRFHADHPVVGETSAQAALERLGALRDAGEQVALIISYESMRAMRARSCWRAAGLTIRTPSGSC